MHPPPNRGYNNRLMVDHRVTCFVGVKRFALFVGLLAVAACATISPSKDVELTWEWGSVKIPTISPDGSRGYVSGMDPSKSSMIKKAFAAMPPGTKFPTVIYMHGSGGLSSSAMGDIRVIRAARMAVIAPSSYARKRPKNPGEVRGSTCSDCWGTFDKIFALRTAELTYALEQVQKLSWVDQDNLFLWGHSEGGYTVAAYRTSLVKGRIITGTGCHQGFNAEEPTIAVISRGDHYVRKSHAQGRKSTTCLAMSGNADNLTYVDIPGTVHNGGQTPEGKRAVIEFLRRHTSSTD